MKKYDVIKDFVRSLSDDDLGFLQSRLSQRLGGDLGEATEFMQEIPDVDKWLISATTNTEFFNKLDHIEAIVQGEGKKRGW